MAKHTEIDIELKNSIKKRINNLLEDKGLKQNDFATLSLKDRQAINRWTNLNNDRGVSIYTIAQFCSVLNITLTYFFDDPLFGTKKNV